MLIASSEAEASQARSKPNGRQSPVPPQRATGQAGTPDPA
jgi:hypothetical protein